MMAFTHVHMKYRYRFPEKGFPPPPPKQTINFYLVASAAARGAQPRHQVDYQMIFSMGKSH